ncbi:MAG: hypothetical protein HY578_03395 [Nitrospinae bacterium]|nr:hypothetical protein [Nitrospinota bacterium]
MGNTEDAERKTYKKDRLLNINNLMEIFYSESTYICSDEIEASILASSVLCDFLKIYPYYVKLLE